MAILAINQLLLLVFWSISFWLVASRIYFFANKKHSETLYRTLYNNIDEICVLRIDLKKYKNTIRFFRDDSFSDLRAIFTYEPIPPYCISEVNNTNVLMNNDIFISFVNKIKKLFKIN